MKCPVCYGWGGEGALNCPQCGAYGVYERGPDVGLRESLLEMSELMAVAVKEKRDDAGALSLLLLTCSAELRGMARGMPDGGMNEGASVDDMKARSRLSALRAAQSARHEEAAAQRVVEVEGGPADNSSVMIDGSAGEGHYTVLCGARYQLVGNKLRHSPPTKG